MVPSLRQADVRPTLLKGLEGVSVAFPRAHGSGVGRSGAYTMVGDHSTAARNGGPTVTCSGKA
jgi:hypothetical protein